MSHRVFFHAGLGKAASTWLQYRVFPHLEGVRYIPRNRFRSSPRAIARGGTGRFLVSRELGWRHFERDSAWFAEAVPSAQPILVLREHGSWVGSQYRRAIKNGGYVPFEAFIDLEADQGVRPQSSARFLPRIQLLEKHFGRRPILFFYEDLVASPERFVTSFAETVGATVDVARLDLEPLNPARDEHRLRVLRAYAWRDGRRPAPKSPVGRWLRSRTRLARAHALLTVAPFVSSARLDDAPILQPEALERVRAHYADDWQACLDYAGALASD